MVDNVGMNKHPTYRGYRFQPDIIAYTVWLYHRFTLSLRDIEDLLAERGVIVSYECSPENIAEELLRYESAGASHLQLSLEPTTCANIETMSPVLEASDNLSK